MAPFKTRLWLQLAALFALCLLAAGCAAASTQPAASKTVPVGAETQSAGALSTSTSAPGHPAETKIVETTAPETQPVESLEPPPLPVALTNPGFEEQAAGEILPGWHNTGNLEAIVVEDRGHSGNSRLTHGGAEPYQIESSQVVSGLSAEWYTLRAWVRSSGGQNEVFLSLQCGDAEKRVFVPSTTPGYRWLQLSLSTPLSGSECTIRLHSAGPANTWASFDDIELVPSRTALSILGSDISSLKKSEDMGGIYRYSDGTQADPIQILKDSGLNYARLRVWVDSPDGYHEKDELLEMAQRLKSQELRLLVDFHYSDHWADPGKQVKPAAWEDLDFEQLKQALYDHTYDVCSSLVAQGTVPDMIQIGNEINAGMLWPDGDYNHFDNLAALLKEGHRAVKDCSSDTLVMLHIAEGGDNALARWWFDNITRRDVPFDVIGISYYPFWHGSLPELQANLNDISARYDKDVVVVETAYAFTAENNDFLENIASPELITPGYPFTPEGQRMMLRDILSVVRGVSGGRGLGIFYWDAAWTAVPGNGWDATDPESGNAWENQALFDYENRALPALEEFQNP